MKATLLWIAMTTYTCVLVSAFVVPAQRKSSLVVAFIGTYDAKGRHITFNPQDEFQSVDHDRAKECVDNFGQCTIQELEQLKSNLHHERFQSLVSGNSVIDKPLGGDLENLMLEEELEIQLELLKEHDRTYIFPTTLDVTKFANTEEHNSGDGTPKTLFTVPSPSEILAFEESIMDENTLETAMICMVMATVMLLPVLADHFDYF